MKKRGISAQVQACRNHIDAIDAQISVVHTTVSYLKQRKKNMFN